MRTCFWIKRKMMKMRRKRKVYRLAVGSLAAA